MKEIYRFIQKVAFLALLFPLRIFHIKNNRIILINRLGLNYSDNPKYIAEYISKKYENKIQIIYPLKQCEGSILNDLYEKGICPIKFNSIKYFFYMMTSRVIVTNSGGFSYIPLRKSQYVINTWHGGGAYKKTGIYMYNNSKLFRIDLKMSANKTNVFLSTNKRFSQTHSDALLVPIDKFLEIGMPRNDCMLNIDIYKKNQIKQKLAISSDKKVVIFAPTYRKVGDNYFNKSVAMEYDIDSKRVCEALKKRFGGEWIFVYRLHPTISANLSIDKSYEMNLSEYDDMQELLMIADVMINDFSSSMWDFMLTGKPVFLYAKDLEHYIKTTELFTPISEWPFPKSSSNSELVKNILNFDKEKYKSMCENHYKELGGCETGKATKIISKMIIQKCQTTGEEK